MTSGTTAAATLNNVTGIQNLPGVFVIDRVNSAGVETASAREVISFTATSGSTVTGLTRGLAGSSDQDHEVGAIVEFSPDVIWAQSVYDALTATVVASTGVLDTTKVVSPSDTQTLFNKMISGATLSSPTFVGFSTIASLSLVSPLIGVGSDAIGDMYYRKSGGGLARLALGTSGQVLTANASLPQWSSSSSSLIGCKVYLSADKTDIGTSAYKVAYNQEVFDTGSAYDTSTYKFTVPSGKAGYYLIIHNAHIFDTITDQQQYKAMIYRNNSLLHENTLASSGTNVGISPCANTIVHLDATDYIEFYVQSGSVSADVYSPVTHSYGVVQQLTQD